MFFDGLAEGTYPFNFIVEHGIHDLVTKGSYKILPVVPQLIIPIKSKYYKYIINWFEQPQDEVKTVKFKRLLANTNIDVPGISRHLLMI